MDNGSKYFLNYHNRRSFLRSFSRVVLKITGAGLALVFGFWLLLASNMGPVADQCIAMGAGLRV
jgi:predicted RND superfamily exporter protein